LELVMKKLIVLLSGVVIAASAAAQTTPTTPQPAKAGAAQQKAPVMGTADKRANPAAEPEDSANSVSTDFQGTSKQETTAAPEGGVALPVSMLDYMSLPVVGVLEFFSSPRRKLSKATLAFENLL